MPNREWSVAKSRGEEPAFPSKQNKELPGLSVREWLAGMAMQGILAGSQNLKANPVMLPWEVAKAAMNQADALLKELYN